MKKTTARNLIIILALSLSLLACTVSGQADPEPTATVQAATATVQAATATPLPSPFPSDTPTRPAPTAFPTFAPPKTLYEERFEDDVTCFKMKSLDKGIELGIEDEAYFIKVDSNASLSTQCRGGYSDFVLEYDVRLNEGDVHSIVGLRFRTNAGSSYNVYITGRNDLCWDFYNAEEDSFRNLAGCWGRLPDGMDIHDNFRIRLIAAGNRMAILINGELVATASDRAVGSGTFGFFVANSGPGFMEVIIDNILIRELNEEDIDVFEPEQIG